MGLEDGNYYYIDLNINGIGTNMDAVLYYASKFAQYSSFKDFESNYQPNNLYTIKGSETVATRNLKKKSYDEFLEYINGLIGNTQQYQRQWR